MFDAATTDEEIAGTLSKEESAVEFTAPISSINNKTTNPLEDLPRANNSFVKPTIQNGENS